MKNWLIALILTITALSAAAEGRMPDSPDMSDCRKLYADTLPTIKKRAEAGSFEDRDVLAKITNNRFACFTKVLSNSTGWSVVSYEQDLNDKNGKIKKVRSSTQLIAIETLKNNPEALTALREAQQAAQSLAEEDIAFRNLAASFTVDYKDVFNAGDHADAYSNIIGVEAIACRRPQVISHLSHIVLCLEAKSAIAELYPLLSKAERRQLETKGLAWAERFAQKSNPHH